MIQSLVSRWETASSTPKLRRACLMFISYHPSMLVLFLVPTSSPTISRPKFLRQATCSSVLHGQTIMDQHKFVSVRCLHADTHCSAGGIGTRRYGTTAPAKRLKCAVILRLSGSRERRGLEDSEHLRHVLKYICNIFALLPRKDYLK